MIPRRIKVPKPAFRFPKFEPPMCFKIERKNKSIREVINHTEKIAKEKSGTYCDQEYKQIAVWLKELLSLRKKIEHIEFEKNRLYDRTLKAEQLLYDQYTGAISQEEIFEYVQEQLDKL